MKPSDLEHAYQHSQTAQKVDAHLAQADLIDSELHVFFFIMQHEEQDQADDGQDEHQDSSTEALLGVVAVHCEVVGCT